MGSHRANNNNNNNNNINNINKTKHIHANIFSLEKCQISLNNLLCHCFLWMLSEGKAMLEIRLLKLYGCIGPVNCVDDVYRLGQSAGNHNWQPKQVSYIAGRLEALVVQMVFLLLLLFRPVVAIRAAASLRDQQLH